jgi:hypothetical protein
LIPARFFRLHHAAELQARAPPRFVGCDARRDEIGNARVDVKLQLPVELVVSAHRVVPCYLAV